MNDTKTIIGVDLARPNSEETFFGWFAKQGPTLSSFREKAHPTEEIKQFARNKVFETPGETCPDFTGNRAERRQQQKRWRRGKR